MNDVKDGWTGQVQATSAWQRKLPRVTSFELLTSETDDADLFVVELRHELSRQDLDDVGTGLSWTVVVEHEQRLDVHAEDAILQIFALYGAEEVNLSLLEATQHDRGNGDVRGLLDMTHSIVISASTVQDDDLFLVRIATSQLRNEATLVD
jgi:hypothetical protein